MGRPINRIAPKMGPAGYKTYQIIAPRATHYRPATCEETRCEALAYGWKTVVDESTDLGMAQADYIRRHSGRRFSESRDGALTAFVFAAGQKCFAEHTVPLDREPLYLVKDGDFRGNPRGTKPRRHVRPADWVEDFAEHQDRIASEIEKG